ncbi:MAG: tRNA threonylcarbamoyladenosine dehydratase, partial [Anaerovorax sp.]
PDIEVEGISTKLTEETIDDFSLQNYDYVVDAIDDVRAKLLLIAKAKGVNVPVISSMGTGNKLDPTQFQIVDIKKTHTCPLAKVMRKEIGKMGLKDVKVLFSPEIPHREEKMENETRSPASISFVPASAGLLIAWDVVRTFLMTHPT